MAIACVVTLALALADAPVALRPNEAVGEGTRVVVSLKGDGLFKPGEAGKPAGDEEAKAKPLAIRIEAQLEFVEKVLAVDAEHAPIRSVRRAEKAGVAINGEVRATSATLRPEVATLVAERKGGRVVVVSPGGPLTRAELELMQGPGDPLALAALLPSGTISKGETWGVGSDAARSLSGYDTLDDNALKATLESIDDDRAVARLAGTVRGSSLGGPGTIRVEGLFRFDRRAGRVDSLRVERSEDRKAGPVEDGLEIKSTLVVTRQRAGLPPELSDDALAGVPLTTGPDRELLLFRSNDGLYTFVHDRDWHIYWDGDRQTILKRLDKGRPIAHCKLSTGPDAGKGQHQDPAQLREDIRRAAGTRFVAILGEGQVDGAPAGGYRYKVAVQGRDEELDVLWYYALIAGPRGDQVLAVFTLSLADRQRFGEEDLRLLGTFEWIGPAARP